MSTSAYKYLSDDGNTYQLVLDDAFAAALGYALASGSEPYLPSYIAPRYASFQTSTGVLMNAAYITYPFNAFNPPASINVGGTTYLLKSSYGEQRGFSTSPTPSIVVCVPAPASSSGSTGVSSLTAGTGISVSGPTGAVTVSNTGLLSMTPAQTLSFSTFTHNSVQSLSHSLGRQPYLTIVRIKCTTSEGGYAIGDQIYNPPS